MSLASVRLEVQLARCSNRAEPRPNCAGTMQCFPKTKTLGFLHQILMLQVSESDPSITPSQRMSRGREEGGKHFPTPASPTAEGKDAQSGTAKHQAERHKEEEKGNQRALLTLHHLQQPPASPPQRQANIRLQGKGRAELLLRSVSTWNSPNPRLGTDIRMPRSSSHAAHAPRGTRPQGWDTIYQHIPEDYLTAHHP